MSLAGAVDRYGRAIALAVALLAGAGIVAGTNLPSSIYPRLEFPRVVIIGNSGTLPGRAMMPTPTKPTAMTTHRRGGTCSPITRLDRAAIISGREK